MATAIVFETHPAVRGSLVRQLGSNGIAVLHAFTESQPFLDAIEAFGPDFAVIGLYGRDGLDCANEAHATVRKAGHGTRVFAIGPDMTIEDHLHPDIFVIEDSPRCADASRLIALVGTPVAA